MPALKLPERNFVYLKCIFSQVVGLCYTIMFPIKTTDGIAMEDK
jgi:hypothetical protein